jgi:hypothetical protein
VGGVGQELDGLCSIANNFIKMALVAKEVCKGNWPQTGLGLDGKELNPFQYKSIWLNLSGTGNYDPSLSWISTRREDGQISCGVFTFVDNKWMVSPTMELTWQASHAIASKLSYLGIQDAAAKACPCSQTAGAWAGAIIHVLDKLGVCVLTSKEK